VPDLCITPWPARGEMRSASAIQVAPVEYALPGCVAVVPSCQASSAIGSPTLGNDDFALQTALAPPEESAQPEQAQTQQQQQIVPQADPPMPGPRASSSSTHSPQSAQSARSLTAAPHALLSNVAGFSRPDELITREELAEQGAPSQEANARIVQQNIEHTFLVHFSLTIFLFALLLCLLIPTQLGLFIWLAFTYADQGGQCDGPLRWWAIVVFSFTVFNATINRKTERGSIAHRVLCCYTSEPDQRQPEPLRVWAFDFLMRILLPFVWNCFGIHWVRLDGAREVPCEQSAYGFYLAAKVYSTMVLVFSLVAFFSMIGLATMLRFVMRHGLLRTSNAASPSVIENCKVVPLKEIDLQEHPSCCICMVDYDEEKTIVNTDCWHYFHKQCLGNWLQVDRTCPLCRKDLAVATE